MKGRITQCIVALLLFSGCTSQASVPAQRWSEQKATQWYASQGWPIGINYVSSNAVNQFEMWQDETFDGNLIDRELSLAEGLGFNAVRIFLHDMLWEKDPTWFKNRISEFLEICDRHGMKAIVTFFTNGGTFDRPVLGKQPDPIQGLHNSRWIQSPGAQNVNNPDAWPRLEKYVKDVMTEFKDDDRVLYWCLYNEPENFKGSANSMPLLREVFKWGREVNPSQPLTSPIWLRPGYKGTKTALDIVSFLGENCDIMTFHCYYGHEEMQLFIDMLKRFGRPMICQEYMGRPQSTFEDVLPILKKENVGAISWGLVKGKCNFHLQWGSREGDPESDVWFHDIFNQDGTPYSEEEIAFIRSITGKTTQIEQ